MELELLHVYVGPLRILAASDGVQLQVAHAVVEAKQYLIAVNKCLL